MTTPVLRDQPGLDGAAVQVLRLAGQATDDARTALGAATSRYWEGAAGTSYDTTVQELLAAAARLEEDITAAVALARMADAARHAALRAEP